jgi:DNA primase
MSIDFEKFLSWAESHFDGDVVVKGNEIRINSPFAEDHKHHCWCNPMGGKKGDERPMGVYHCWKTDKKGTLVGLVMEIDHCEYDEALEILGAGDMSLARLEEKLTELFSNKKEEKAEVITSGIQLPSHTFLINEMENDNFFRLEAEIHLDARKIPFKKFYVCVAGDYRNRIIIPYYDRTGKLIYWNGRYMGNLKDVTKYRGPDKSVGVGKGDVIYMPSWPEKGSKVYFCEGEFNAESLCIVGLNGGAFGGKNVTEEQAQLMRDYIPVICVDNDKAGGNALPKIGDFLFAQGITRISYVRPPNGYKDWNDMLVKLGPNIVRAYVLSKEKMFDEWTSEQMRYKTI